jgi:hypothetical protein
VLSCYTVNLIAHLSREDPAAEARLAAAVRLSVRLDAPGGGLAFSQHERIAPGLGYRAHPDWAAARAALAAEFARRGGVLAVASTRHVPWSPGFGRADTPHWVRLAARDGDRWLVVDDFDALLPLGRQEPYRGWTDDAGLRALLTPLPALPAALHARDVYALGAAIEVPPPGAYRWLEYGAGRPLAEEGSWVHGTAAALAALRDRLATDPDALRAHAEDLWAAGRHHQYRDPSGKRASAAWSELARAVRFAVQSAERGRPRPSLVRRAFDQVLGVERELAGAVRVLPLGVDAARTDADADIPATTVPGGAPAVARVTGPLATEVAS